MRSSVIMTIALLLIAANALADSIDGRLGVIGRLGAVLPLKDDMIRGTSDTTAGLAAGGGLMFGFGEHVAASAEVFHMPQLDVLANGVKSFDAAFTDIALGLEYRFLTSNRWVPSIGIGPDIISADLKHINGTSYKLDWTYGGHVNLGLDWFITPGIALAADVRGVYAIKGDIMKDSTKVGDYRPQWFQGTIGFRFILPKNFYP